MKSLFARRYRLLSGFVILSIGVWAFAGGFEAKTAGQKAPRYFGEEFAEAQRGLKDEPAEERPEAF